MAIFHRLESPSQTPEDAARQEKNCEIWGKAALWSDRPTVKAYVGLLPVDKRGIQFETEITPDPGSRPGISLWDGSQQDMEIRKVDDIEYAILRVSSVINRQPAQD